MNIYSYEIQAIYPETGLWAYYGQVMRPMQHTGFNGVAKKSELAPEEFARRILDQHVSRYGAEPAARVVVWDFSAAVRQAPLATVGG